MPRGDKSSYTDKQKRQAAHIEQGYEHCGVGSKQAGQRAWATVNKETGDGNKCGSGRGVADSNVSSKRRGRIGGASASRPAAARSRSAKKAAATRRRNAVKRSPAPKSGARKTAPKR